MGDSLQIIAIGESAAGGACGGSGAVAVEFRSGGGAETAGGVGAIGAT
jgi:hypothetical protein